MESMNAIKSGTLDSYSESQIVDCSGEYGNDGCDGGFMDNVFDYTIDYGIFNNFF